MLAWGGHIATRLDWGQNNSAVSISGSAFHMRVLDLDGSGGNQDRSLTNDAVIFPGSITIVKVANSPGSFSFTGDLGAFPLNSDGVKPSQTIFDGITLFKTYSVTETLPNEWKLDSIVCSDGSTGNVSTATASINLAEGENVTRTFKNSLKQGNLQVIKHVVNDNGGDALPSAWTLKADGPTPISGAGGATSGPTFKAGTYTLSESGGPSGYAASAWSCDGVTLSGNQITLGPGESKTCTITNDDQAATLIVIKHVENPFGGTAKASGFTLSVSGNSPNPASFPGAESPGTPVLLKPGSYSVTETGPRGYRASLSADCSGSIGLGQTKTCTVTNTQQPGTIVIKKTAVGGSASFAFTATGDGLPGSFSVSGGSSQLYTNLKPGDAGGSRTVEEGTLPSHWDFTSLSCDVTVLGDGTTSYYTNGKTATITNLGAGDTLTCTFTNTKRGEIRIIKGAVGGDGTETFYFGSTGGLPSPAVDGNFSLIPPKGGTASVTFSDLLPGNYTVTETGPFGTGQTDWKLASVVCSATGSGSSGTQDGTNPAANINVGPGGSVTCTFTNVRGSNPVTDTSFCPLPNDQFRLIYHQDTATTYGLNASNPGQFYDNTIYKGVAGDPVILSIRTPFPFVTHGAVPIQVHSSITVTENGCLVPMGDLTSEFTIIMKGEYGENHSLSPSGHPVIVLGDYDPENMGSTVETIVTGKIPETGLVYVTTHLDYGLKQTGGWTKGTKNQAIKSPVTILDPQGYGFSFTPNEDAGATLSETVYSRNTFKSNPGFAGVVTTDTGGTGLPNVEVQIYDPNNILLGTVKTDTNGEYLFTYKYTGKAANFTLRLPGYPAVVPQTVTLKSNSFAVVNFTLP